MNILEEEDFIKGLPDSVLMEEAQRPTGTLTQYVVMSEIQRRSKMRKEHEAQLAQGPQSTVKDQIIQEGIMSSMPPQMAMAPQMAQRMPNMPPQGIQQAMPPQIMSGGGIVGMANGGFLDEVVVKAPNLSEQKLEELIMDGVPTVDLIQMGFTSDDISRVGSQIDPRIIREGKKILGAAPDAIYDTLTFDPDRGESIVKRGQEAQQRAVQSAQQSFLGRTDIPRGEDPPKPFRTTFGLPFDFSLEGTKFEPVADLIGSGITSLGNAYDRFMERSDRLAERREAGSDTPRMDALRNESVTQVDEEPVVASVPAQQLGALTIDPNLVPADASADDPVEKAFRDENPYGIERVDIDDATIPSGADAASSRLAELQAMIDKQSAAGSSAAKGAALVALGTSIMEGKTAQGGAKAAEILSKDAQAQGALQLEGAKLRLADARQGEKLQIMRDDLANKLNITDRQSLMAVLKSYGDEIRILSADRAFMLTKEGRDQVQRMLEEQALLRTLLVGPEFGGGAGTPTPTPSQPSGVNLKNYLTSP